MKNVVLLISLCLGMPSFAAQMEINIDPSYFPNSDTRCSSVIKEKAESFMLREEAEITKRSLQIIKDAYKRTGVDSNELLISVSLVGDQFHNSNCRYGRIADPFHSGISCSQMPLSRNWGEFYIKVMEKSGKIRRYLIVATKLNFFFTPQPMKNVYRDALGHIVQTDFVCTYALTQGSNTNFERGYISIHGDEDSIEIGRFWWDPIIEQVVVEDQK